MNGQALSGGSYIIKVTQNGGGRKSSYDFQVVLIPDNQAVFDTLLPSFNPVPPTVSDLMVQLAGAAPGTAAYGDAYNLAGERVGSLGLGSDGALHWNIPAGTAPGVYLIRVTASNLSGRSRSQLLKIAVLR
jgi:hypothetical protein